MAAQELPQQPSSSQIEELFSEFAVVKMQVGRVPTSERGEYVGLFIGGGSPYETQTFLFDSPGWNSFLFACRTVIFAKGHGPFSLREDPRLLRFRGETFFERIVGDSPNYGSECIVSSTFIRGSQALMIEIRGKGTNVKAIIAKPDDERFWRACEVINQRYGSH